MIRSLFVLSSIVAAAADEEWAARWEHRRHPWGDWRDSIGPVRARCRFEFRLGLQASGAAPEGPELIIKEAEKRWTARPEDPRDEEFLRLSRLCSHDEPREKGPAHLMVSNSASYLFRQWPYFANRVVFSNAAKMQTFVWIGELPEKLADSVSPTCLASRQGTTLPCAPSSSCRSLRSIYFGDERRNWINSNHYNKIVAATMVLDHPMVTGVFYLDLDAYYRKSAIANNPRAYRETHDDGRWDVEFASVNSRAFWLVKGGRFYLRDKPIAKRLLDSWIDLRCGFKDQWPLWHSILTIGKAMGCLEYDNQLLNMTVQSAMKTALLAYPSLGVDLRAAHDRCPRFRFNVVKLSRTDSPIHRSVYPWNTQGFSYFGEGDRPKSTTLRVLNVSNLLAGLPADGDLLAELGLTS